MVNFFYKAGSVIKFDVGAYSDRETVDILVATKDIDLKKLAEQFITEIQPKRESNSWYGWNDLYSGFLGWLVKNEVMSPLQYSEFDLGYDRSDEDFYDSFDLTKTT